MPPLLNDVQLTLARAIAPEAWAAHDAGYDTLDEGQAALILASSQAVLAMGDVLLEMGVPVHGSEGTLKQDMVAIEFALAGVQSLLRRNASSTRGDLNDIIRDVDSLVDKVEAVGPDISCDECGEYNNDGEGFNGLCGSCADAAESARASADHPSIGDRIFMSIDEDVVITVASVPESQPHLLADVWTIVDENGDEHLAEDDGDRWTTVSPDRHDISPSPNTQMGALFEEQADDAASGEWRGQIHEDEDGSVRSTACLYPSAQTALLAAVRLHRGTDPLA